MSDLFLGTPVQHREESTASRRSRRGGKARKMKERRKRRRRSIGVITVALALVLGAVYVVWSVVGPSLTSTGSTSSVSDFPGPGQGSVEVAVASGDTGTAIGATLKDKGVVATTKAFTQAFAANPDAPSIQPGTYTLSLQMKASDAVAALLDPASRVSLKLTVQEGLTVKGILAKINSLTGIPTADLDAAAADTAALGLPAQAGGNLEGWLRPLTYQVEPGATATSLLQPMVAKTVEMLTAKGVAPDQWETVLIKASIVEREAKRDEDRPKIARAIENRLAIGKSLEIDSTTSYMLDGRPPTTDENWDQSNPYSTYVRTGLPPGPIASPSEKSIDAVLSPADGPWLFWVAVNLDTGETKFATTFDEHTANVAELRAWQAANGK